MLVSDILEQAFRHHPEKPAVWYKGLWKTYRELRTGAEQIAAFLIEAGVKPGDRVALLLENSFEYVCAHFGVLKAGAVDVSLNTELKAEGLHELLLDCEAKALIADTRLLLGSIEALNGLPALLHVLLDQPIKGASSLPSQVQVHTLSNMLPVEGAEVQPPRRMDGDLASLVYTSGVTGKPKGVMLSHVNLVSNARSVVQYLGLGPQDRMMVVLPFYYIYGRSLLYTHVLTGGSLVIDNRFAYPVAILNTMQEQEVTCLAGVPTTYSVLLNRSDVRARTFPHLRFVAQAGGGMSKAMQKAVAEVFHPARLFVMYGSTEAAPRLTYVEPEMLPRKWGSIGRAIPDMEVVVADEQGRRLLPHVQGEIAARGPSIMMGYWKDPEATAQVLRHGYYFTGDLGFADEDGYVFLTGRARDMIKTGGNRVSAKEIEDVVSSIPGVLETAVVGVADEILGEAIKVFLVPASPELTEDFVKNELRRRLPLFKHPKWVEFRQGLPKNQSGKILKSLLAEQENNRQRPHD
jgi:acyl-CoA synthetase (AMP-forming)/AMP-acid ligase II